MSGVAEGSAYALARLHARYAQLLPASGWRRLARIEHFSGFVQEALQTVLRPWVLQFDPQLGPHRIEATLRQAYLRRLREVAGWLPRPQRAAVVWIEPLVMLPIVRHRAAAGADYAWLPPPPARASLAADSDGATLLGRWLDHWQALWPDQLAGAERRAMLRLRNHGLAALRELRDDSAAADAEAGERLALELRRIFRRFRCALIAACAYLGLLWLQTARLRGALLRRRIFAPPGWSSRHESAHASSALV
ncbi:MAG: hypothetical protein KGJ55_01225 [Gammaproteobacteria bacterium]|nr:hypothetical protein [Gammaproteobacteria bacterium]